MLTRESPPSLSVVSEYYKILVELVLNLFLDGDWSKLFLPPSVCSVTKERSEVILEGTYNSSLGRNGDAAEWLEIEFKCKPGATNRRPCIISPYHYRLDWLMWFAAFQVHIYTHYPVCKGRLIYNVSVFFHMCRATSTTHGFSTWQAR